MRLAALPLLGFLAASAHAQHSVQITTNYYRVHGTTLPEIHQSFRQARPWRGSFDGMVDWRITWRFNVGSSSAACRLNSYTTATTIRIVLPWWGGATNSSSEVTNEWRRYFTALSRHEHEHVELALAAATEVRRRIEGASGEMPCGELSQRLNQAANEAVSEFRRRDAALDRATNHGIKEGAALGGRGRRGTHQGEPGLSRENR